MKQEIRLKAVESIEELKDFLISKGFILEAKLGNDACYFSKKVEEIELVYSLTSPHEGNYYMWLFRANRESTFERWSCCEYEKFYKDIEDFKKHWNLYLFSDE